MIEKVKMMEVSYKDIKLSGRDAHKIRGCFANQDRGNILLHHHKGEDELVYTYPKVQYKVIKGHPYIVAICEGIQAIYPIVMGMEVLTINQETYNASEFDIKLGEKPIGDIAEMVTYKFLSPWLCLNQKNFKAYEALDAEGKEELLARILKGNILSLAKGLGVTVNQQLEVVLQLKSCRVNFKNEHMIGFTGQFKVNYLLPNLLGLGKSVSRGFGTIVRA